MPDFFDIIIALGSATIVAIIVFFINVMLSREKGIKNKVSESVTTFLVVLLIGIVGLSFELFDNFFRVLSIVLGLLGLIVLVVLKIKDRK